MLVHKSYTISLHGKRKLDIFDILWREGCGGGGRWGRGVVCEEQNHSFVYNKKMKLKLIIC